MIENAALFIHSLSTAQLIGYFWPFFMLDMTRYVIIEGIILAFYFPKRKRQQHLYDRARKQLFTESPLISVIVPGKNEGKHIPALVKTLKKQTYSHFELIVVDDGSNDDTPNICRKLQHQGLINCFIRNDVRGGKASAANTALYFSSGKYIVHIDADSHLKSDSLETILLPFYLDERVGAVGGDVQVANSKEGFATRLQAIEYLKSIMLSRTIAAELGLLRIISGAYGAFRRDILDKIYGWDVGPGLDGDITLKIRKLNYRIAHEPTSICYTNAPTSFRKLAKQRYRWDKSMIRFRLRKHVDILLPSAKFSTSNFISVIDNLVFNLFLDIKWFIYLVQIISFQPDYMSQILVINYFLYIFANVIQYVFVLIMQWRLGQSLDWKAFLFLPLVPLYTGLFLRLVRTNAYIMEFIHKRSYFDAWNPWKVSQAAKRYKL